MLFGGCASIKAPQGGAVDETPPELVNVIPTSGTVNFSTRKIEIEFSEYMDEASFRNNIKIYPQLDSPFRFKFKGKKIILTLPDSLKNDQTYIIQLNRNIKDEHKIALANAIQIAYSTGNVISGNSIYGKIYGNDPSVVHLWKIKEASDDSLFATMPDYVTDVSETGNYSFNYLPAGNYQILAVEKRGAGLPLVPAQIKYGKHWKNILTLGEADTLKNINFRLWKEPAPLKIVQGEWSNAGLGWITFNNDLPIDIKADLQIQDSSGTVIDSFQYYLDPLNYKNLIIKTNELPEQNELKIYVNSLKHQNEVLLDSAEITIKTTTKTDTSKLQALGPSIGYGSISGTIANTKKNLAIELISMKNPSLSQTALVNSGTEFEFKTVPAGNYSLLIFKDDDNNMKYTFGKAFSDEPSEWFYFYPDSFEVRANWDTEIAPIILSEYN